MSKLTELKIEEVSLVDEGANPQANVMLIKRREPDEGLSMLRELVAKATARLEEELAQIERRETETKAARYEILGLKKETIMPLLHKAKKEDEGMYKKLTGELDAALEAIEKSGLFGEVGKKGYGSVRTFEGEIEKKRKANPGMSYREAADWVYRENPEWQ